METTGQCVRRSCSVMERDSWKRPKLAPSPSLPKPELAPSPSLPKLDDGSADAGHKPARFLPTEEDLVSEEAVWSLYRRWCLHHDRNRTTEQMKERFNCFQKRAHRVIELNRLYNPGCRFGLTAFSDRTDEEDEEMFGGDITDSDEED